MLTYKNFIQEVKETILQFCPEEYQGYDVELTEKYDGNTKLDGIILKHPEENIAPVLYLNGYYKEMYEKDLPLEVVMRELASDYQNAVWKGKTLSFSRLPESEMMLGNLYTQVVNFERNQGLLKSVPYLQINDLAIIARIKLTEECSMKVTDDLCQQLGWDGDSILATAIQNNERIMSPTLNTMEKVVMKILGVESEEENLLDNMENIKEDLESMYVLSNEEKVLGASLIADKSLLDSIGKAIGEDYFILPSSVHELLLLPQSKAPDVTELKEMVMEVNRTQIAPEEFLSDNVYFYDGNNREIQMYSGEMEREKVQTKQEKKKIAQR